MPVAESRVLQPRRTYLRLLPRLLVVDAVALLPALARAMAATVAIAVLVPVAVHVSAYLVTARRRNAAGPSWAATFTGAAWLIVRWDCLLSVEVLGRRGDHDVPSFVCRDAHGGWATLVPRLAGWPEVARVVGPELLAARDRGVRLPPELLAELADPTDVRLTPAGQSLSRHPFP